ncbi:nucleotide exchange factor GrpE [Rubrimonas cliftonensis]|uniref:Protein GrpE n=1 Tax=Rubrimonas cliftonensis TaxID=89524 RepID=A0A1H4FAT6_9RHOB|nr:nucleotide exchange factor GrpE [Rubrimonas cliftonensis]SEA93592.1 molecular chaperone GrpE [Rubrimonas cliftonensis]
MSDTRSDADEAQAAETTAADAAEAGAAGEQAAAGDAPESLETALAAAEAERDELRKQLMYALAETENVRKRAERDRRDAEAYGGTRLARDLLSVHDNLERAVAAIDDTLRSQAAAVLEGVDLTQKELLAAFAKHRIEKLTPEPGERFDPNLHQAMFEAPAPGAEPGTVIQVMQSGFTIAGRLLRPALVGVARAEPAAAQG